MQALPAFCYDGSPAMNTVSRAERIILRETRRIEQEQAKASFLRLVEDLGVWVSTNKQTEIYSVI